MNKISFLIGMIIIYVCQSCNIKTRCNDPGKEPFVKAFQRMYLIQNLTDHFPKSWDDYSLRTERWSSRYCCSEEEGERQSFSCLGVFVDNLSLTKIDSLENTIEYKDRFDFKNTKSLKINFFYLEDEDSYRQAFFDTIKAPIYDFREADFNLGIIPDSVFSWTPYGYYYVRDDKEILPLDLRIYIVDARPGNFWKNKEQAEKEPRPILPNKWKHGYSRGIGVSRSCERVCWWVMAW